jgi:hypothetical protein
MDERITFGVVQVCNRVEAFALLSFPKTTLRPCKIQLLMCALLNVFFSPVHLILLNSCLN